MTAMPFVDVLGFWLGIFLTFCILSFLYKDNPFYKFAEHLFIGVSVGYVVVRQAIDVVIPKGIEPLFSTKAWWEPLLALVPVILVVMMFFKLSKRWAWVGRYPVALVVALYAGLQVNNVPNADLVKQLEPATQSIVVMKIDINRATREELIRLPGVSPVIADRIIAARPIEDIHELPEIPGVSEVQAAVLRDAYGPLQGIEARATVDQHGGRVDWFGTFSLVLMALGLIAGLVYFYFSAAHTGAVGHVSRFGIWILMVGFGASFGFTVQGRISLAIGRAMDVLGQDKSPVVAEQIHGTLVAAVVIACLVTGLIIWETRSRGAQPGAEEPGE